MGKGKREGGRKRKCDRGGEGKRRRLSTTTADSSIDTGTSAGRHTGTKIETATETTTATRNNRGS